jgi:hypothetical protein
MSGIAGNQIVCAARNSDLQKRFVVMVGQGDGKRGRQHYPAISFNIVEDGGNLTVVETKLGALQYLVVFR